MNETTAPDRAQAENLRLLLEQTSTSARASILAALLSFALIAVHDYSPWLVAWLLGVIGVSIVRMRLVDSFDQCRSDCAARRWERRHLYTGIVSGGLWGLLGLQPIEPLPVTLQGLTLLGPALVAMAALSGQALRTDHYRAFLGSLLVSLLLAYGWRHGVDALFAAPLLVLFGILLDRIARRYGDVVGRALSAHAEIEQAHRELAEANRHLMEQHRTLLQEEQIARHVFEQLTLSSAHDVPGVHAWNQPMGNLSGDLIQVVPAPDGATYVFLGDFTGHGLPAALGAVPASTVFRAMAEKAMPVELIACELNRKLHSLLPTGYFCCAVVMRVTPERTGLRIWNGGLPPVLIRRADGTLEEIGGANLPLGVVGERDFLDHCTDHRLLPGDRVIAYSDGLTEAEDHEGNMWGRERLLELLRACDCDDTPAIERLRREVMAFTELAPASDDISVIEIDADATRPVEAVA